MWATRLSADTARVDNVPFLQDGVAEGETVRFTTDADGVHWATGRVADSGNCTVRVLPVPDGPLGRDARAVHERFSPFGLGGEVFSADFPLVALTVPGGADFRAIKALLVREGRGVVALRGLVRHGGLAGGVGVRGWCQGT
ncbi:DUF4265 domain-containing protein [Streptomyces cavourensis]